MRYDRRQRGGLRGRKAGSHFAAVVSFGGLLVHSLLFLCLLSNEKLGKILKLAQELRMSCLTSDEVRRQSLPLECASAEIAQFIWLQNQEVLVPSLSAPWMSVFCPVLHLVTFRSSFYSGGLFPLFSGLRQWHTLFVRLTKAN